MHEQVNYLEGVTRQQPALIKERGVQPEYWDEKFYQTYAPAKQKDL